MEAGNGEVAAAILQQRNGFDVVFTDIRLGGTLNGWDVGEISRETHPEIPVVYTSGAVIIPERPVPGSIHISKPYDGPSVLKACRTLCEARKGQGGVLS